MKKFSHQIFEQISFLLRIGLNLTYTLDLSQNLPLWLILVIVIEAVSTVKTILPISQYYIFLLYGF